MTIAYAGVWLALAMLFSVIFRSAATAALVALGLWLFLTADLAGAGAGDRAGHRPAGLPLPDAPAADAGHRRAADAGAAVADHAVRRMRAGVLLDPTTRTLGPIYLSQLQGAVMGAPLPLGRAC